MNQLREPLNNQQLTEAVVGHEKRIVKLETKKKKPRRDNKPPRITIANVMQALVEFQSSVDQRLNKLESSVESLNNQVNTLNNQVQVLNDAVFKN